MAVSIDRERSADRIEREIETLAGAGLHHEQRGDPAVRVHAGVPPDARPFLRRAARARVHRDRGPGRDAGRAQPCARRAGLRRRLPLRLEPQRREVRRDDGRRHGARGVPAERGARPRPPVAAHLVPRGGGLRLRPDAARQPDHVAAGDRGRPAGAVPRARRRAQLLGARGGRGLRARPLARVGARPRRPRRLDRDAHRAGPRAAGHRASASASSTRSPATSMPTFASRGAATTPARRRWGFASTRRPCSRRPSSSWSGSRPTAGGGTVGTVGEIEVDPGLINASPPRRASRSTCEGPTTSASSASPERSPASPRRRPSDVA